MSLFSMAGRFYRGLQHLGYYIGRKNTYFVFMVLGFLLYCTVPYTASIGSVTGFVLAFPTISGMCGGGSRDGAGLSERHVWQRCYVGAIHGMLITAWSMAGIFGPVLVNYIREYNITHGVPKAQAYNITMYIMAGLFIIGFIANALIKAVDARYHVKADTNAGTSSVERWGSRKTCRRIRRKIHDRPKPCNQTSNQNTGNNWTSARSGLALRRHPADAGASIQTLINSMKLFQ